MIKIILFAILIIMDIVSVSINDYSWALRALVTVAAVLLAFSLGVELSGVVS